MKIRVHILSFTNPASLEEAINKFCSLYNSKDIVDIKLSESNIYYTAMIIYKIKDS